MESKITVDSRDWIFDCNGQQNCTIWTSSWICLDGDVATLYIDNKLNNSGVGFTLECFSGAQASKIYISDTDFGSMWAKTSYGEIPISIYDYEEQCVIIADYLCSLFCKWAGKQSI